MKTVPFSAIVLCVFVVLFSEFCRLSFCEEENFIGMKLGGVHDYRNDRNTGEIEGLARFAVQEHNKKENTLLEFSRVLKAKEQVVAGKMYYLTLEANDGGKKEIYDAKVWVKPWMSFKQLQDFKHADDVSSR